VVTKGSDDLPTLTPAEMFPFRLLGVLFGVTALLILLIGLRLAQRGRWLPSVPTEIGAWTVSEKALDRADLDPLGFPNSRGWVYRNLFAEEVEVQLISTSSFESYLDPKVTGLQVYGLGLTAEKRYPLFGGDGSVRALMFRRPDGQRVLWYYWVQEKNGRTNVRDSLKQSRDFIPRLRLGLGATLDGTQNCVIRAWTKVHPADIRGLQARRNLNEICLKLHDEIVSQKGKRP
jgi:hypothetical protein